ncbi:MAG: RagB/SusD family nutrient uptake outer membrane protein [Balneolaceae bacterium]
MIKLNRLFKCVVIGSLVAVTACTDLSETVYDQVTEENFNPSGDDIGALVAPAYSVLRGMKLGWYSYFDLQEESSDIMVTPVRPNGWYDGGTYIRLHKHEWDRFQGQPSSTYNQSFSGINAVNRVIHQIESGIVQMETGGPELIAELRGLRAYYYWILLDNFGNVPIVTDFADDSLPEQNTRQQVYDFVVSELTDVMPDLTEEISQATYGRFTKWAAQSLLTRTYLNAEVYTGTGQWAAVIDVADDLIDNGPFVLEPVYKNNFSLNNSDSQEIIWAVPYDELLGTGNQYHMKSFPPIMQRIFGMEAQPWGGNAALPQFIDTYDEDDGRLSDTWLMGEYEDPDTGEPLVDFINYLETTESGVPQPFDWGYSPAKYEVPVPGAQVNISTDYPIFRFAEILMAKAEAELRTGNAGLAADIVNQVRERNFDPFSPDKMVTAADLTGGSSYQYGFVEDGVVTDVEGGDDIVFGGFLDELGYEFAAESHRRMQIIRFKTTSGESVFTAKSWFKRRATENENLIIFPLGDGPLNTNSNLEQNPGYE